MGIRNNTQRTTGRCEKSSYGGEGDEDELLWREELKTREGGFISVLPNVDEVGKPGLSHSPVVGYVLPQSQHAVHVRICKV